MKQHSEEYWINYLEKQQAAQKKWRAANKEKVAAYQEKWRDNNPEKVRSYRSAYNKRRWQMIKRIKLQLAEKEQKQQQQI